MADLDEVSAIIGEIRSDVKHALKWFDEHEERDQERYDLLANRIDHLGIPLTKLEQIARDVEASKPVIEGVRKMKWIVAGFVTAIALVGGAVGGRAEAIMKWFV